MIDLGLARISRLVPASSLAWKAIHVAGTNGKGSIAGYLSSLLTAGGLRCGSFTSPHLVDRWDCITINEHAVQESLFRHVEEQVKRRDASLGVGATEFELLTATAFEIFRQEDVDVGVVEVGMGGRLDSTNILTSESVLVSVIANIGLDHQAILGRTLAEIAAEKAGIMKPGVPCVVDGTNEEQVKSVIRHHASRASTTATFVEPDSIVSAYPQLRQRFHDLAAQPHQRSNISCAVAAFECALPRLRANLKPTDLLPFLPLNPRAGRLQLVDLWPLIPRRDSPVLLDGAHNPQSAKVLASYVDQTLRRPEANITWVIAASQGKDLPELFGSLLRPGDNVAAVQFGPVDGMPWVRSVPTAELLATARSITTTTTTTTSHGTTTQFGHDISKALQWAHLTAADNPIVIAGSLYLVSDVLRLLRQTAAAEEETAADTAMARIAAPV
ncbi:Dihydrofolate synthetase [Trichophyton interdigitale]|uniref:Dihydrofolate synthetase n=1 Tax=Trichophyton interdigitale TaxID=101480 RepID=A0A9P4YGD9_9EURO|nr:Dihydrofolate synthetase [Trichophyton interdigitale]KAF3892183.1 Dihydrofolate synthetase [Trichophyton interdigitale]KAG8207502.1 Dihydrofolate synthetase [Trichophyton interdigitale]